MTGGARQRIVTLDVIRGIAVMGIFSVNVVAMAMVEPAYFYPPAWGWDGLADQLMWGANFILIDGKMRSLFSILFGASMLLVIERAAAAGRSPGKAHFARMAVLLAIGLLHFYLLWWGDILTLYAMVGAVAFLFWRAPVGWLLILSVGLFVTYSAPRVPQVIDTFQTHATAHAPGASAQAVEKWQERSAFFIVTPDEAAKEKAFQRSPVAHARTFLSERPIEPIDTLFTLWAETLALMLLGMAGYKSGFLTGEWSDRSYRKVALIGLGIGFAAFGALTAWIVAADFQLPVVMAAFFSLSNPVRPVMALGYAALIILLFRRRSALRDRIAAVGRAAFTNYLGATVVGTLVFMGVGFGLFNDVSRFEAWLLVPLTWALMLVWSKPWLDRFAYGPLEWLWRSLSRWEVQPMRRRPAGEAAAVGI